MKYFKNTATDEVIKSETNPNSEIYVDITDAIYNLRSIRRQIAHEIEALKLKLKNTDYQAIKYAEGWISEIDYAEIKAKRQAFRDRINILEKNYETFK